MAQFKNIYKVELNKGSAPVIPLRQIYYGDVEANRIGAIVLLNGEEVTLSGSCSGTAILSDGSTVAITGTVDGSQAYVELPAACYSVEGQIEVYVKLTASGVTTTLMAAVGTVRLTETDTVIDPGTIIPSVAALVEDIDEAKEALADAIATIPADYSALLASIAPTFSSSTAYTAGSYVWYSGTLYRFTADHAAGAWTGSDAAAAVIGADLASLKSAIDVVTDPSINLYNPAKTLYGKTINVTTGEISDSANYNVTEPYTVPAGKKIVLSAYLTSATTPYRANANACRRAVIYKPNGTVDALTSETTAYEYTNEYDYDVDVRYQLWGDGASRSATDIYIVIVDADVTVPPSVYSPYSVRIASNILTTSPQIFTDTEKTQVRLNIGANEKEGLTADDFITEMTGITGVTIGTEQYTGDKTVSITGGGSSHTWKTITVKCIPARAYVLEFWGQASDVAYHSDASQNAMLVVEFFDATETKIGSSKYNSYVLGKTRLGYHKYGFVSPFGARTAHIRVVTRGTTIVTLKNVTFTMVERYMPRHDTGVVLVGHLGMTYSAPRNTIPGFELGSIAGFNTNVVNPNVTSDGVLVALHNDTIDEVSDGTGNVYDYTYQELQAYDFGSWFNAAYTGTKLPTLEECCMVMAAGGQRIGISFHGATFNTHMTTAKVKEACGIVKKYSSGKPLIKSFALLDITDAAEVLGEGATYVYCLEGSNLDAKIETAHESGFQHELIMEFPAARVTSELITLAKSYGFGVSVYFGNEPTLMKEQIKLGVNRFTVDTFSDVIFPMD